MKEKIIRILQTLEEPRTFSAIARECGCSVEYVRQTAKDFGYQQPDRRLRTA